MEQRISAGEGGCAYVGGTAWGEGGGGWMLAGCVIFTAPLPGLRTEWRETLT